MTSLTADDSAVASSITPVSQALLKTDVLGRLRITREHRQRLIEEFDRSGTSAARFAQLAGLKYSTFAAWVKAATTGTCRAEDNLEGRNNVQTVLITSAKAAYSVT